MSKNVKIIKKGKYYFIVPKFKDYKDAATGEYYKYIGDK